MSEKKPALKLGNPVGRVPIYFTDRGFSALRSLQAHYQQEIQGKTGNPVNVPYSTTIHMALNQLCEMKGIEIVDGQAKTD